MPSLKKGIRSLKNWRDKRGSSNDVDDSTRENNVESPTKDPARKPDAAHTEQLEDQNLPSATINDPPGEQEAVIEQRDFSLPDPEPSGAAIVQPEIPKVSITPPESIWNEAYDSLKSEQPKLVEAYEKILSMKLNGDSVISMNQASVRNVIQEENVSIRRAQMCQLIDNGLEKTMQEANIKGNIGTAMQVVNATKKIIGDTIKDIPQAALPWAIVSVSLEILTNPISQTEANHKAIKYIGDTIKWYWEHAARLFGKDQAENHLEGLQRELRSAFIDFYQSLLQFQMKSICDYYRHRGVVFLRDLVKLDDWDGSLRSIREDDESLRKKVNGFRGYKVESHLEVLTLQAKAHDKYQRTQEDQQCLRDLFVTDPRGDKARIEETKGGLFEDSYRWIFENPEYGKWHNNDQNRLLWLSGDPGKGKTMLLCGIVQELMQQPDPNLVTFFFCQATIQNNSDYVSVLRSLIWLLADQQPFLTSYIRNSYDNTGKALFDGTNAWYKLSQIFSNMLCDNDLSPVYIIIDALDECTTGRTELLQLIQKLSTLPKVKFLVSSRNWPEIGGKLINEMNLSLEVNAGLVGTAVELYILYKASQLHILSEEPQLKEEVCRRIRDKANGTFLWVAIVFKSLYSMRYYDDGSEVLEMLDEMPEDLTQLYATMLERISLLKGKSSELCRTALAIATLVYRPLHLNELSTLAGFHNHLKRLPRIEELIKDCGSFLTVQENRIYFIHQSAKDYLTNNVSSQSAIFPDTRERVHSSIVSNSLDAMSQILRENVYELEHPATLIDDVCPPKNNPLDPILYSCANWVAHLCELDAQSCLDGLSEKEKILGFLKTHFLHWLEALSLTRNLSVNIVHVKRLTKLLKQNSIETELQNFVYDASRFMQYHSQIIETAPRQIYSSAILFSPTKSLVRTTFIGKLSSWITSTPPTDSYWSPCLQIIEARHPVVVESRDMQLLILNKYAENVEIWDMVLGKRVHVLNHTEIVLDAAFSSDLNHFLTVTSSQLIFWDIISGEMIQNINIVGLYDTGQRLKISKGGKFLAAKSAKSIQIYNVIEASKIQIPWIPGEDYISLLDFRWSNEFLYILTDVFEVLWDVARGTTKWKFDKDSNFDSVRLRTLHDPRLIAFIETKTREIVVWDLNRCKKIPIIGAENYPEIFSDFEFSNDTKFLAIMEHDSPMAHGCIIQIWNVATGQRQHTLNLGKKRPMKFIWSSNSEALVTIFYNSVELHDLTGDLHGNFTVHDTHQPYTIMFSANSPLVATAGFNLKIWDSTTGNEIRIIFRIGDHSGDKLQFSLDSKYILNYSSRKGLKAWDIASGSLKSYPPKHPAGRRTRAAFSHDGRYFAIMNREIQLWGLTTNEMVSHSSLPEAAVDLLALSNNAAYLVSVSESSILQAETIIKVWSVATGKILWTVKDHTLHRKGKYAGKRCATCGNRLPMHQYSSIAISNHGMVLYVPSSRHDMILWSEGKILVELTFCCWHSEPHFDNDSPYVITQVGRIHLDKLIAQAAESFHSETMSETMSNFQSMTEGYGISSSKSWIMWNGKNILWLPPDYRTKRKHAISRYCIVIETDAKGVCILNFSGSPSSEISF